MAQTEPAIAPNRRYRGMASISPVLALPPPSVAPVSKTFHTWFGRICSLYCTILLINSVKSMPPNSLRRTTQTLEMIGPMGITLYSHFPIGLDESTQQQPVPTRTNISSRGKCPIQSKGLPLVTYFIFSRRFSCLPSSSNHPHMKPPTCGCRGRLKRGRRSVSAKAGVRFLC